MPEYDSAPETIKHIKRVRQLLLDVVDNLDERALKHDASKLEEPEKSVFDKYTPKLKETVYNSEEYKLYLREMGPGLEHHYKNNSHHPEFHEEGIRDMSYLDIIEMLADWKAANERHSDGGDLLQSIKVNQEKFGYSDETYTHLVVTARELGWL